MTPIESAARALSQDYWAGKCNTEQLAAYVDRTWPRYVGRVRLVLEAVREPSEGMEKRGDRWCGKCCSSEHVWTAMIDKALEEG